MNGENEDKYDTCPISSLIAEIEGCNFICEGGDLKNHKAFITLKKIAEKWPNVRFKTTDEQDNEVAVALLKCIKTENELKKKSDEEVAKLLIDHIQSQFSVLSPAYELLNNVIERLAPNLE